MKFFKNKLAVTLILLSVAFCGLIIYSFNNNSNIISSGLSNVISPIQKVIYSINENIKNSFSFIVNFKDVKEENIALTQENEDLQNKLTEYNSLKEENERLRSVLNFTEVNKNYNYLGCNIIGYSGGNISNGYVIDRGIKDGIDKDMVVINSTGLVGKITKADENYSVVQSILNENIAVAVMVDGSPDTTGILQGIADSKNRNLALLSNLPIDSNIKEGDIILTSGLGMVYPKNIRVGEVVSVEVDNVKVMKNAVVKPFIDFKSLQDLFVIIPKEKVIYN